MIVVTLVLFACCLGSNESAWGPNFVQMQSYIESFGGRVKLKLQNVSFLIIQDNDKRISHTKCYYTWHPKVYPKDQHLESLFIFGIPLLLCVHIELLIYHSMWPSLTLSLRKFMDHWTNLSNNQTIKQTF